MDDSNVAAVNRAAVYNKPGTISTKIVELEIPEPGPGEVLLRLWVIFRAGILYQFALITIF